MIALTLNPIDVGATIREVATPESGGIDLFVGTTRNRSAGKAVTHLEYEAYEPMAVIEMERLVAEARKRWSLHRVAIVHRLGRVPVGEASVVIGVSSAHRHDAFEACRYLIDTLKKEVPIWKRETFSDGSTEWSGGQSANIPSRIPLDQ